MSNWKSIPFKEIAEFPPKISLIKGQSYSFIPMEDISGNYKYVSPRYEKIWVGSGGTKFENGDTLFARITPCLQNGKIAQVKGLKNGKGFGSTEYFVFRGIKDISDSDFVYYLSQTVEFRKYAIGSMVGASGRQRADAAFVGNIEVYLPPLPTQRRIASILSAYDDLIENNLKRIKLLEELAQRTYEEWFVKFRINGKQLPIDKKTGLPVGWEKITCIEAMEVLSGGTPKTTVNEFWNGNIEFFTPKDASAFAFTNGTEKKITETGLKKCNSRLYPKYTLFITARGTVGKLNLALNNMAMNQSCYALKGRKGISPFFLYNSMLANIQQFKSVANGGVFDTIVVDTFRYMPFTKPSQTLVNKFEIFAGPIYQQVERLVLQNRLLKESRDLLLPRLMTGKLEV